MAGRVADAGNKPIRVTYGELFEHTQNTMYAATGIGLPLAAREALSGTLMTARKRKGTYIYICVY